jgi:hypothetical protein
VTTTVTEISVTVRQSGLQNPQSFGGGFFPFAPEDRSKGSFGKVDFFFSPDTTGNIHSFNLDCEHIPSPEFF